jgi:cell division protein FtsL
MYGGITSPKTRLEAFLSPQRRQYIHSSFLRMKPSTISITCVLLVGLMAVLYLSQMDQVMTANRQLQDIRNEQAALERQNQDLADTVAQEQSPASVIEQAQKMGLVPVDPKRLWVIQVAHLQSMGEGDGPIHP